MVYQVWEIDPFTAIKNLWGTFLNEEKANLAADELLAKVKHRYIYVSKEEVIE